MLSAIWLVILTVLVLALVILTDDPAQKQFLRQIRRGAHNDWRHVATCCDVRGWP